MRGGQHDEADVDGEWADAQAREKADVAKEGWVGGEVIIGAAGSKAAVAKTGPKAPKPTPKLFPNRSS